MRLPHHPECIETLRIPTERDPWRVLMSGCLFGQPCGVNADDYGMGGRYPAWLASSRVRLVPFCPETHALGAPRNMPDLHGGDGFAVLDGTARVLDEHRNDLTAQMLDGARAMVALAQRESIDFAVLLDRSAACGSQVISVGCRLEEPIDHRHGVGVAAAALLREGFHVVSQRDFLTLQRLGRRLDPALPLDPDARDHHNHPWVLENLPLD